MKTATEFIKFALSHANPATVMPSYNIEFPVGNDRVWCYLYGTTGTTVTESLIRTLQQADLLGSTGLGFFS